MNTGTIGYERCARGQERRLMARSLAMVLKGFTREDIQNTTGLDVTVYPELWDAYNRFASERERFNLKGAV